jgi:hypothetical protein
MSPKSVVTCCFMAGGVGSWPTYLHSSPFDGELVDDFVGGVEDVEVAV